MDRLRLLTLAALLAPAVLFAQGEAEPAGPPPAPLHRGFGGPGGPGLGGFGMGDLRRVVTGLPYSAEVTTTMNQTLADGNTINRSDTGHVARDGQGRVYIQQSVTGGPWAQKASTKVVFLSDPVAGYTYILNATEKVAVRREFHAREGGQRSPNPNRAKDRAESDLGQQTIASLVANGKAFTRTIPAGTIGNAEAITERSEVWTSPDLQIVLSANHLDPRMGRTTYTLSNVQKGEPNTALFQVPSDYTIKDAPGGGPRGR